MAILYFIHTFIFSQLGDAPISVDEFKMIEDGRCEKYPWGKIAFSKLIKEMRQEFSNAKQMYHLGGMPYALNAWIYECASQVPSEIVVRVGNKILKILNWRVVAVKPKFETFMSTIFSEYQCSNIVQSQHEMESIIIHGSQQKPEASTSAAKVNFRKPHEVSGFEDFSTTPPTKLLKRFSHVADTASPHPSKRMKTSPTKEPIQVETANIHKDFIPPNESEKPVSPDNVPAAKSAVDNISEQNISSDVPESFDKHVSSDTLKKDEPSVKIQKVDDVSEHNIVADDVELFDQHMSSDTLKEPKILIFTPQLKDVSVHQMEPQRADTDQLIANSDTLQNTAKKDGRIAVDKTDKVEEQVEEIKKEKIKPSTSKSNTSAPFLTKTLDVIDALIYGLLLPAMPLTAVSHEQVVQDECLLRDSQLPTTFPSKPNVLSDDAKIPFQKSRIPSKILQSPYLSNFGSSEKGKEKLSSVMHQTHPFKGFGICYHLSSELFTDYSQWIDKGLLKSHGNKDFHWVLAVVVLKKRLIRVYDSLPRRRSSNPSLEIQKIAVMLPTYLQDSGFFDNNERTDWSSLDSYKDKSTDNMLEPHHPFTVEYVEGIAQQGSDSLDCGVFLAIFAEYRMMEFLFQIMD
ncbi:uncharacterized protein LOC129890167 [Solanum dulcamara]|uniref:uncharacterized protein LOC129890167 n=1 Tax=Solanum dulcamara TaxID=45834 RepID=UPI0024867F8D|nr:uncharacterized protein LOC129890167 [Solanum dulcamara]